jgi:TusA-related sulfurtransferase
MHVPEIRPGKVADRAPDAETLVVHFPYAATANSVIQWLVQVGVRSDALGVTPPDRMPRGKGMALAIRLDDPALRASIEEFCTRQGGRVVAADR